MAWLVKMGLGNQLYYNFSAASVTQAVVPFNAPVVSCMCHRIINAIAQTASIAESLGVNSILQSMQRINTGNAKDYDHENMENQWDIEKTY